MNDRTTSLRYFHTDHLGSIAVIANELRHLFNEEPDRSALVRRAVRFEF